MNLQRYSRILLPLAILVLAASARAADLPQWGERNTRNQISPETGLPDSIDLASGKNVKWIAPLGTQTYATPVIAEGKVFIGTNNDHPRDPAHPADYGVLLCLNETDGSLAWQLLATKISAEYKDPYMDWPKVGFCSAPTVEDGRVYIITSRNEVVCADIKGLKNGNDGPFKDEAKRLTPKVKDAPPAPPATLTDKDADILWVYDMPKEIHGFAHDSPHASILILGRYLYINTSNGVGYGHKNWRNPDGPSIIVLDKATGRLVAMDKEGMGTHILHCNWSSPTLGKVGGKELLFYGASDNMMRAFEPLAAAPGVGQVATLKCVWKVETDLTAPREIKDVHEYMGKKALGGPCNIEGMTVFDQGRLYFALGGDYWWGKAQAWLKCFDAATGTQIWELPLEKHTLCTPSVKDGLVYATDCGNRIICADAATGKLLWSQPTAGDFWSSTLVADGKVYAGSRKKDFWILAHGREKKVLCTTTLDSEINGTPVAANGVLYVATMKNLYAFAVKK